MRVVELTACDVHYLRQETLRCFDFICLLNASPSSLETLAIPCETYILQGQIGVASSSDIKRRSRPSLPKSFHPLNVDNLVARAESCNDASAPSIIIR